MIYRAINCKMSHYVAGNGQSGATFRIVVPEIKFSIMYFSLKQLYNTRE